MTSRTDGEHLPGHPDEETGLPSNRPPIIGIAGGIGSGKSAVAEILANLGCIVSNADADVRHILANDLDVRRKLVRWWGDKILAESGEPDRHAIARIVFKDDDELRRLEELLHPRAGERRKEQWSRALEARGGPEATPALIIDAPLLFEVGLDAECDAVIYVEVPREIRLQRVRETRGWDENELDRREKTQWSLDTKRERSDYVIRNDASLEDLMENVTAVLDTITRDTPGKKG